MTRPNEDVLIAFMCDAYRQSKHSSSESYSLVGCMRDVLKVIEQEDSVTVKYLHKYSEQLEEEIAHLRGHIKYLEGKQNG